MPKKAILMHKKRRIKNSIEIYLYIISMQRSRTTYLLILLYLMLCLVWWQTHAIYNRWTTILARGSNYQNDRVSTLLTMTKYWVNVSKHKWERGSSVVGSMFYSEHGVNSATTHHSTKRTRINWTKQTPSRHPIARRRRDRAMWQ